jgi:hypothetical protein
VALEPKAPSIGRTNFDTRDLAGHDRDDGAIAVRVCAAEELRLERSIHDEGSFSVDAHVSGPLGAWGIGSDDEAIHQRPHVDAPACARSGERGAGEGRPIGHLANAGRELQFAQKHVHRSRVCVLAPLRSQDPVRGGCRSGDRLPLEDEHLAAVLQFDSIHVVGSQAWKDVPPMPGAVLLRDRMAVDEVRVRRRRGGDDDERHRRHGGARPHDGDSPSGAS